MKRLIMIAVMAIGVFSFSEASAQKVIKAADGKVYIDVQDMPAGTWTTTPIGAHTGTSAANSLFKRFEVDKSDLATAKWDVATANCTAKGWRLPTQRELMLMWIMKEALTQAGVDALTAVKYWASTESSSSSSHAWYVKFSDGDASNGEFKTAINSVRCVREVK